MQSEQEGTYRVRVDLATAGATWKLSVFRLFARMLQDVMDAMVLGDSWLFTEDVFGGITWIMSRRSMSHGERWTSVSMDGSWLSGVIGRGRRISQAAGDCGAERCLIRSFLC